MEEDRRPHQADPGGVEGDRPGAEGADGGGVAALPRRLRQVLRAQEGRVRAGGGAGGGHQRRQITRGGAGGGEAAAGAVEEERAGAARAGGRGVAALPRGVRQGVRPRRGRGSGGGGGAGAERAGGGDL